MKLIDTEIDFPRLNVAIEAMKDSLEAIKNIYRDGFKITIKSDKSGHIVFFFLGQIPILRKSR